MSADFTLTARFSDDDLAFCFVDIHNDLADLGHIDMSGQGIFNADDWSSESCLYLGALKAQIGFDHFAVYELQIFAVAKGLGAADSAVFKGDIFAVPRQVFTFLTVLFRTVMFLACQKASFVSNTQFSKTESVIY